MKHVLVIGFGNTLRGDDGAGIHAAERAGARFKDVDVLTVQELQPELAETISHYEKVVFLDAAVDGSDVHTEAIEPATGSQPDGSHLLSPGTLLSLCQSVYGRVPHRSLLIAIPGENFDFGEQLSPLTEKMVEQALEEVGRFLLS